MKTAGIIAEFNPLHTGHEYLMRQLRLKYGAEFCVVVMSGDYVQRGEPALFSKFLRTQAALLSGADLVLELPLSVSTGSAEYFAEGAISLLNRLGCIDYLGFGSESGDICAFQSAGKFLSDEPETYRCLLQQYLKKGMSFPRARYEALSESGFPAETASSAFPADRRTLPDAASSAPDVSETNDIPDILSLLGSPNNILGTEYCKALHKLHSSIVPVTVKRRGAGYHETSLYSGENGSFADRVPGAGIPFPRINDMSLPQYASASGLRKAFLSLYDTAAPNPLSPGADQTNLLQTLLQNYIPDACRRLYPEALRQRQYLTFDDLFLPLHYTLQYIDAETLARYQDVTPEFSQRLLHVFRQCSSVTELCDALKTKNLTFSRITRCLLHILLRLTKDAVTAEREQGFALYARILGFRREAKPLLSEIKKHSSIPLVAKLADAGRILSPLAFAQLDETIKASGLYRAALGAAPGSEYTRNIIIM